jgi:hypothetical protein
LKWDGIMTWKFILPTNFFATVIVVFLFISTAFIIKMPLMHRLACLRDDVIFLIFCYQKYKYKTDFTRVNEYGQCEVPTEEMLQDSEREKEEETAPAVESPNERNERNVDSTTIRRRRGARDKTN